MARPVGTEIVKWDVRRMIQTTQAALNFAMKDTAAKMQNYVQNQLSKPYPPASSPGNYPHIRTGQLKAGVYVSGTTNGIRVYSQAQHGVYLQWGTENMEPRPWATKMLRAQDWSAEVKKAARAYMARTGYGPKGRKK